MLDKGRRLAAHPRLVTESTSRAGTVITPARRKALVGRRASQSRAQGMSEETRTGVGHAASHPGAPGSPGSPHSGASCLGFPKNDDVTQRADSSGMDSAVQGTALGLGGLARQRCVSLPGCRLGPKATLASEPSPQKPGRAWSGSAPTQGSKKGQPELTAPYGLEAASAPCPDRMPVGKPRQPGSPRIQAWPSTCLP